MNRISLGTVQFGLPYGIANQVGQISRAEARSMLRQAFTHKIDTIDTAITYGESETCLGEAGVKDFKIITKLPAIPDGCLRINEWVEKQLVESLCRLDTNKIYGFLLHRPEQLLGLNGRALYEALERLKRKGMVEKIGISIYSPSELESLTNNFYFDLIQAPFNLIDQRLFSTGWMRRLKDSGVEIHTRSTFLQGLLLMNHADIPKEFVRWSGIFKSWHQWLEENNVSALSASLAFTYSFPEIDRVVVGADSQNQLLEIINAANNLVKTDLPNLACEDESLINPSNWTKL